MTTATGDELPLAGIRVVEFAHMVMGPTCGLILADLGAEVIKVEPAPDGDNTRRLTGSGTGFFATYNRNKKSLAVDLKSPAGLEAVKRLIRTADVVSENFRPGALDALGLGYEALKAEKPDLIYVSHKGFLAGPCEERTALDEVVQMMGGLAFMTGLPDRPLRAGASVNDVMGGMFGAIGVLAKLHERGRTGKGAQVKSALFENTAFLVGQHMAQAAITGKPNQPMTIRTPAWGVHDTFATADGQQLFLGVVTDTQWRTFCEAFGRPDLASDPELAGNPGRCAQRARLIPEVQAILGQHGRAELIEIVERIGLPFAPIAKPHELFDDPHLNAGDGLIPLTLPDGRTAKIPALPLELDGKRLGLRHDLPRVSEHTAELLAELGYSEAEIAAMMPRPKAAE